MVYCQKCAKPSHLISNCKSSFNHVTNLGEPVVEDHYPFEEDILKTVDSLAKFFLPNLVDP